MAQLSEDVSGWQRLCWLCSFGHPFCDQSKHLPRDDPYRDRFCGDGLLNADLRLLSGTYSCKQSPRLTVTAVGVYCIPLYRKLNICDMRYHWRAQPGAVLLARSGMFSTYWFLGGSCPHSAKWMATWGCHSLWHLSEITCPSRAIGVTRSSRIRFQVFCYSCVWGKEVSARKRALIYMLLMQNSKMELLLIP